MIAAQAIATVQRLRRAGRECGRRVHRAAHRPCGSTQLIPAIGSAVPVISAPAESVLQTSLQDFSSVQHSEQIGPAWNGAQGDVRHLAVLAADAALHLHGQTLGGGHRRLAGDVERLIARPPSSDGRLPRILCLAEAVMRRRCGRAPALANGGDDEIARAPGVRAGGPGIGKQATAGVTRRIGAGYACRA